MCFYRDEARHTNAAEQEGQEHPYGREVRHVHTLRCAVREPDIKRKSLIYLLIKMYIHVYVY